MNLSEMLCYADIGLLDTIAKQYACECSSRSKNELIQAILSALHRKDSFDPLISELTDGEIGLLNRLLFDRRSYYSLEELTAFVSQAVKSVREERRRGRGAGDQSAGDDREVQTARLAVQRSFPADEVPVSHAGGYNNKAVLRQFRLLSAGQLIY